MFIFPVAKGLAPNHFVLVSQHQDKSFCLTFLGDYQVNPTGANPYMVITAFDELADSKDIVPLRGDLISHLDEDEGAAIMQKLINSYLIESEFEVIRQFNHSPNEFKYEQYIQDALTQFNKLKDHMIENKAPKVELGQYKKHGHKTDEQLNIHKGGIIR